MKTTYYSNASICNPLLHTSDYNIAYCCFHTSVVSLFFTAEGQDISYLYYQ